MQNDATNVIETIVSFFEELSKAQSSRDNQEGRGTLCFEWPEHPAGYDSHKRWNDQLVFTSTRDHRLPAIEVSWATHPMKRTWNDFEWDQHGRPIAERYLPIFEEYARAEFGNDYVRAWQEIGRPSLERFGVPSNRPFAPRSHHELLQVIVRWILEIVGSDNPMRGFQKLSATPNSENDHRYEFARGKGFRNLVPLLREEVAIVERDRLQPEPEKQDARDPKGVAVEPESSHTADKRSPQQRRLEWLAKAMLLVREHPEWTDARIAREVGVDPAQLTKKRCPEFQAAAALARDGTPRRGHVTFDRDSRTSDVEAYDGDDPAERDWD